MEISIAPSSAAGDAAFVAEVVALVNRVYTDAEKGLWVAGAERTNAAEMATVVSAGQLVVAGVDGRLVGAVRVQRIDGDGGDLGEFGMLVAHPDHRGTGVGRDLVTFAEDLTRRQGLNRMQLELLVPRTWRHPVKEFLRVWYTRIGYAEVRTEPFAEAHPALQPLLATPCDFVVFHKDLRPA